MITALLLAAGSARRFGAPKLLEEIAHRALVRVAADALLAAGVDALAVVVPPDSDAIRSALRGTGASFIVNPEPDRGIGTSIATGVAMLDERVEAVLIALADEPWLDAAVIARVLDSSRAPTTDARTAIVAPRYRGVPGHPVLFDRSVFPELCALTGDHGARTVIERDATRVRVLAIDAPPPSDVDTREDLARVRRERQNMSGIPTFPSRDR